MSLTLLACMIIAATQVAQGPGAQQPAEAVRAGEPRAIPDPGPAAAQLPLRYVLLPARTTVGFFARANVGAFRGRTSALLGWVEFTDTVEFRDARGEVEVQLAALKTGIGMRDADLRAALETERYPVAAFHVTAVERVAAAPDTAGGAPAPDFPAPGAGPPAREVAGARARPGRPHETEATGARSDTLRRATIRGDLTIHGTTRAVAFDASYRFADDTLRVAGQTEVRLPDFGIRKPRRFLGLLQVDEQVRIEFDAVFVPEREQPGQAPGPAGEAAARDRKDAFPGKAAASPALLAHREAPRTRTGTER